MSERGELLKQAIENPHRQVRKSMILAGILGALLVGGILTPRIGSLITEDNKRQGSIDKQFIPDPKESIPGARGFSIEQYSPRIVRITTSTSFYYSSQGAKDAINIVDRTCKITSSLSQKGDNSAFYELYFVVEEPSCADKIANAS